MLFLGEPDAPIVFFYYSLNETWNSAYANVPSDEFIGRKAFFEEAVIMF